MILDKERIETGTIELLGQDFALPALVTYADLEAALAAILADMMAYEMEALFNILYRMDVTENKIIAALHPENPELPNISLARTIIERQRKRVQTKMEYPQKGTPFFS